MLMRSILTSVSYTHLEDFIAPIPQAPQEPHTAFNSSTSAVSAIETKSNAAFQMPQNLVEDYILAEIEQTPVPYTHLDVYKRQTK